MRDGKCGCATTGISPKRHGVRGRHCRASPAAAAVEFPRIGWNHRLSSASLCLANASNILGDVVVADGIRVGVKAVRAGAPLVARDRGGSP